LSTEPLPSADGELWTVALPPVVWLFVLDQAQAVAFPDGASSALPDTAVAVAGAPMVVLSVEVVALAPEPVTVPLPLAIIGAVNVVPATEAPLV
jgi:hypothetical protein